MRQWLSNLCAQLNNPFGKGRKVSAPQRRSRLGIEALEKREVMSGTPIAFTPSSSGWNLIDLNISGTGSASTVQVFNNGTLQQSQAVSATSAITLTGNSGGVNIFEIENTPVGITTTVQLGTPGDQVQVGHNGSAQTIQGTLNIQGFNGTGTGTGLLSVSDETDTATRNATINGTTISGLTPPTATINYSNIGSVTIYGSAGYSNRYNITGTPGYLSLINYGASDLDTVTSSAGYVNLSTNTSASAVFYGAAGKTNTFTATPTEADLSASGFHDTANNFAAVTAYSGSTQDTATLTGGVNSTNILFAYSNDVILSSSNATARGYENQAVGFRTLKATSYSHSDAAYLYGASTGTNIFTGMEYYGLLSGSNYSVEADNFNNLYATSESASDIAYLDGIYAGSTGQVNNPSSYVQGDGFYNGAYGFNNAAIALNNGTYFYGTASQGNAFPAPVGTTSPVVQTAFGTIGGTNTWFARTSTGALEELVNNNWTTIVPGGVQNFEVGYESYFGNSLFYLTTNGTLMYNNGSVGGSVYTNAHGAVTQFGLTSSNGTDYLVVANSDGSLEYKRDGYDNWTFLEWGVGSFNLTTLYNGSLFLTATRWPGYGGASLFEATGGLVTQIY